MPTKQQPSKNSVKEPEGISATAADFQELLEANPSLQLPLINIVQKRLLAEKDMEIERLKSDAESK